MLSDDVLAPGWEWRGPGKVKRGRKHYIKISGTNFRYVSDVSRGVHTIVCKGDYPYLKLAALTHCDDEIQRRIREYERDRRRRIG